ncbi:MAG TPA: four helix bundle protein [Longimicrobiales bacterium]|nr:four helix bundle protein [Longimicrobiales bacterium]
MAVLIQDTPVYREAMAFAIAVDEFAEALPRFRGYLKDQLRRASLSILLNLREGGTELLPREKARFYRIAKRSAAECATALDFAAHVVPQMADSACHLSNDATSLLSQLYRLSRSQLRRSKTEARQ